MYYVITRDDSIVIGITTENAYEFNLPNVSIHEMDGSIPDLNQYAWDHLSGEFVRNGTVYSKREFMTKFTLNERATIRASADPVVIDIMDMLDMAEYINTQDPATIQSVQYLAMAGLIAAERVTEIIS